MWSHGDLTFINGGTLYREHQPCFTLVDRESGVVTHHEIRRGGRVGFKETIPPPAPRSSVARAVVTA